MSRLSDVIGHVIETEMGPDGRLDITSAVSVAASMLDDEDRHTLVNEALGKRLKDAACKSAKAAIERFAPSQQVLPFPNLRHAHALDTDGRTVKLTTEMTEMEFRRVMEIRRKQVADDAAYLHELEQAYRAVEPFWRQQPDMTFGEVSSVYSRAAA